MTRLRTSRLFAPFLVFAAVAGCDRQPRSVTATTAAIDLTDTGTSPPTATEPPLLHVAVAKPRPPKPDPTRLSFDPTTRTLAVYDLPDRDARWMLALPPHPQAVPVERVHQFPPETPVDLDKVAVFYVRPTGPRSQAVSLREIVESHLPTN